MHYLGGKFRIVNNLSSFLEEQRKEGQVYFEPFVGSSIVLSRIKSPRVAADANYYLISLYKALQAGWSPPSSITEIEYNRIKGSPTSFPPWLVGFVGFGCSFSGKWFAGFARDKTGRNYCGNAKNSLLKLLPKIRDVTFIHASYEEHNPTNSLVYCDPPYEGTTQCYGVSSINYPAFWETMRNWSNNNKVFISSYSAPLDFKLALTISTRTDLRGKNGKMIDRDEKVWTH